MGGNEEHFNYFFDEFFCFNGVIFMRGFAFSKDGLPLNMSILVDGKEFKLRSRLEINLPSPDVAKVYGEKFTNCRFCARLTLENINLSHEIERVVVQLKSLDCSLEIPSPPTTKLRLDPMWDFYLRFFNEINASPSPKVLEIGSRARSGITRRELIPNANYTGIDIYGGPNVDIVADVHELGGVFEEGMFDFIFSISVFEHLVMPWKAVLEINRILKLGGLVYVQSHQTWPEHDAPADYFRFSKESWKALFNAHTGFEIVQSSQGIPAHVVPMLFQTQQILDNQPGWLLSGVIARKISSTALSWNVPIREMAIGDYPTGEIEV